MPSFQKKDDKGKGTRNGTVVTVLVLLREREQTEKQEGRKNLVSLNLHPVVEEEETNARSAQKGRKIGRIEERYITSITRAGS